MLSLCTATRAKGCNNEERGGAEEQTNRQFVLPVEERVMASKCLRSPVCESWR